MSSVSDRLAKAKPRTETVRLCLDGSLVNKHQSAVVALNAAMADDDTLAVGEDVRDAAEIVRDVEAEMDAATIVFTVGTVSREKWADLLAQFPPSKEERRAGHDHDPRMFPVHAVAACIQDPADFTIADALALASSDSVPPGEWNKLWVEALRLNVSSTPAPKLKAASGLLQANEPSSTTPPNTVSPEDGSLAGCGEQ